MRPRRAWSAAIAVAALPAFAPAAAAQYTLIDNYQTYGGNTPARGFNHGVFTQAPAGGEQYGRGPFNARGWNDDPRLAVADGATSTLFFRTLSGFHNYMGMSDANHEGFNQVNAGLLIESTFVQPLGGQAIFGNMDFWFKVWLVSDNAADTYDLYILGGQFATQTQIADDLPFVDGATSLGLTSFSYYNDGFFDDIWAASGDVHEVDPTVPAPASVVIVLAAGALAARHRHRDCRAGP